MGIELERVGANTILQLPQMTTFSLQIRNQVRRIEGGIEGYGLNSKRS